jgi:glycerol-1-phosphate dehydrogenase [NAD(P)+]
MPHNKPAFFCENNILPTLIQFLHKQDFEILTLVADQNTYPALGEKVEQALRQEGFSVEVVHLTGDPVKPAEMAIVQAMLPADFRNRLYLAIGSGSINDIVRFTSHRLRVPFISLPTAPSVDGFASSASSITLNKLKTTIQCRPPLAIFADLDTLCAAPRSMIAAGFGDMFGKITALPDWIIGRIMIDTTYDTEIARRSRQALGICLHQAAHLGEDWRAGVRAVMEALVEEGFCMLDMGHNRSASGAEHSLAHFWESRLELENRKPLFHGTKVAIGTIYTAQYYQFLRSISRTEAEQRLARAVPPDPEQEKQLIRDGWGPIADRLIEAQHDFIYVSPTQFEDLKRRALDHWDEIQAAAATVPEPDEIRALLKKVGAPTEAQQIGFTDEDVRGANLYGRYISKSFTSIHLARMLGVHSIMDMK